jgi:hypothetical protein
MIAVASQQDEEYSGVSSLLFCFFLSMLCLPGGRIPLPAFPIVILNPELIPTERAVVVPNVLPGVHDRQVLAKILYYSLHSSALAVAENPLMTPPLPIPPLLVFQPSPPPGTPTITVPGFGPGYLAQPHLIPVFLRHLTASPEAKAALEEPFVGGLATGLIDLVATTTPRASATTTSAGDDGGGSASSSSSAAAAGAGAADVPALLSSASSSSAAAGGNSSVGVVLNLVPLSAEVFTQHALRAATLVATEEKLTLCKEVVTFATKAIEQTAKHLLANKVDTLYPTLVRELIATRNEIGRIQVAITERLPELKAIKYREPKEPKEPPRPRGGGARAKESESNSSSGASTSEAAMAVDPPSAPAAPAAPAAPPPPFSLTGWPARLTTVEEATSFFEAHIKRLVELRTDRYENLKVAVAGLEQKALREVAATLPAAGPLAIVKAAQSNTLYFSKITIASFGEAGGSSADAVAGASGGAAGSPASSPSFSSSSSAAAAAVASLTA